MRFSASISSGLDSVFRSVGARSGCLEVESGYRKWKCAFDKSNGFARHEMSTAHILFEFTLVKDTHLQELINYREFCEKTASECRRCDIGFYGIKVDGTKVQSGNDTHLQELIKYTSKVANLKSPEI
ncbi:hypothetical protein T09_5454 [Trichinella sp. T9]|nr:hypothetical protein T09_5454 [Trichinella sp. T9]